VIASGAAARDIEHITGDVDAPEVASLRGRDVIALVVLLVIDRA
jgi:hypothetical protein